MRDDVLNRILTARSIAVVGASDIPGKVGYTVLENLLKDGFPGDVFPINAKRAEVQGRKALASVADLPSIPDLAIICTPAATVPSIVDACGQRGILGLLILTAGFAEKGGQGHTLQSELSETRQKYPGMRIIGPNCLGMICPWSGVNASFAVGMPKPGSVAFLSQSGALCTAILDWALTAGIGFSHFISLGNQVDVGFADLLESLADDPRTTAAILYIESIADARHFLSAAKAFSSRKPIVAYKAGRFAESAKAAASHTGALAGVDSVYQAALQRAGIVRVYDLESMFECAELLTQHPQPVGSRLAIVTNAGGPGVMATDALLASRGQLTKLAEHTLRALGTQLPDGWSRGNPVDVLGDADEQRFATAIETVLQDENVDTLLAVLTPQSMTHPTETARRLTQIACPPGKTLLASWIGGQQMQAAKEILRAAHIPTFNTPEQAVRGFMHLIAYAKTREIMRWDIERPPSVRSRIAATVPPEQLAIHQRPDIATLLSQIDSKRLLEAYGIPVTPIVLATTAEQAAEAARSMGFPVVLKIHSPQISHKTDVQGVRLNLQSVQEVSQQFVSMVAQAGRLRPDAEILGVSVEPMISMVHAVELILGAKRDPVFGAVIMVGYGGIATELFQDHALELPPVSSVAALRMLKSLRCWPLLNGYRGLPQVDIKQLVEIIERFSTMIVEQPAILEADVNPLVVSSEKMISLDARILLATQTGVETEPYAHLAILPTEWES